MNILHISRTMGQGGAEKVVYQICKDLDENMVVASIGGCYEKELLSIGIKHYIIPDIDNKNPFLIIKTLVILKKIIKNEKIDVIHSHHRMAAFYSRILTLFSGNKVKRVYTAHNVFINRKHLLNFSLKGSRIIAVGNGVKENLINFYNVKENLIEIIYNSVEKPKKENVVNDEIFNKKDAVFIGTIGRLSNQKGIDIFMKAINEVVTINKNVYGLIIGDGELKKEMINLRDSLAGKNNIVFLGYRSDILDLIKKLNFVVLASRWEGFPLTPIETFMMGKTIIATDIEGNNEIIKNDINGLLFEKDNYLELSKKIKFLINNDNIRKKLENHASEDYIEKYNYRIFVNKYKNLYLELEMMEEKVL